MQFPILNQVLRLGAVSSLLLLSACQKEESGGASAAPAAPPPAQVGVVKVTPEAIDVVSELPGRIAPTRIAEVRPRVGGIVLKRVFEQGTNVTEGQPLFQIDPLTYEVAVASAKAGVAKADAVLLQARQEAERTRTLVSRNTIGKASLDTVVAQEGQAAADLATAQASLRSAEISLDYATVRAPISGRVGRALVSEGALVSGTDTTALATIQQLDPVYADIQQPVAELLRLRKGLENGTLAQLEPGVARVRLMLDDGTEYPHSGRLLFSEAAVEATSGQVTLRAEFPNPKGDLLPGLYVRVAVDQGVDRTALAVPNQAIQRDSAGKSLVYVVDKDSAVEARNVTVARIVGDRTVVSRGVAAGDTVIADGFQKIGPGAPVTTVPWQPVDAGTSTGGSPAAPASSEGKAAGAKAASAEAGPPAPAEHETAL
jgi:membrane fusion protein (multidrug efflux system)